MIFSKKLKIPNPLVPLQINNYPIERGEEVKFLGFILDENLSWKLNVNCCKLNLHYCILYYILYMYFFHVLCAQLCLLDMFPSDCSLCGNS